MEQGVFFWEAGRPSTGQGMSPHSVEPDVLLAAVLPLGSDPTQISAVHATPTPFLKIYFNIFPPLRRVLPNDLFPSGFLTKTLYTGLSQSRYPSGALYAFVNIMHISHTAYETCPESKDTKVLNLYNIFNLQKRHCE
jgi:hypothetical protein